VYKPKGNSGWINWTCAASPGNECGRMFE